MPKKEILGVERVAYGEEKTPEKDREYKLIGFSSSPVGNVVEWKAHAKKAKKNLLLVFEKDGTLKLIDLKTNKVKITRIGNPSYYNPVGWHSESARHSMAAKGMKTGRKKKHKQYKYYRT